MNATAKALKGTASWVLTVLVPGLLLNVACLALLPDTIALVAIFGLTVCMAGETIHRAE